MHADEVATDAVLVRRLLAAQFPQWVDLPIERVRSAGTDNALYRLGDDMVVRLPRIQWAADQPALEHEWLPRLAPLLPLDVPVPLANGAPGEGYPWHWSISPWIDGENATLDRIAEVRETATALGEFVAALHRIDPAGGPATSRGMPLARRDRAMREAIAHLADTFNVAEATAAWDEGL